MLGLILAVARQQQETPPSAGERQAMKQQKETQLRGVEQQQQEQQETQVRGLEQQQQQQKEPTLGAGELERQQQEVSRRPGSLDLSAASPHRPSSSTFSPPGCYSTGWAPGKEGRGKGVVAGSHRPSLAQLAVLLNQDSAGNHSFSRCSGSSASSCSSMCTSTTSGTVAGVSSAGTSLEANLKHITVTLTTWDAVWEVYLDLKPMQQSVSHTASSLKAWAQCSPGSQAQQAHQE
ncbi:hypothetical protein HaLaN_22179 [Haematococcus lacustris]|uniref:Uncharacterized protein n=1 Tax=Haematococcus lacustris TaxID=44745 RepID=A0A699ZT78_HAELA|nr:hypothetical protein HaLaN_22179 [Haematococcus lacustris]